MKLSEIIQEKIDIHNRIAVDFKGEKWFPISGDLAGTGVQARVHHTGHGVVTKMAVLDDLKDPTEDPSVKFIELILDHQDNPFFPNIYHAKIYKDKSRKADHNLLIVQMEKLIPLNNKKIVDVIPHIMKQIGIDTSNLPKHYEHQNGYRLDDLSKEEQEIERLASSFYQMIKHPMKMYALMGTTKNPQFKEAIDLLLPYFQRYGNDLHIGNWMVRLTGHGPQLVITDPFAPTVFEWDF
jgi:hypothetical protein